MNNSIGRHVKGVKCVGLAARLPGFHFSRHHLQAGGAGQITYQKLSSVHADDNSTPFIGLLERSPYLQSSEYVSLA